MKLDNRQLAALMVDVANERYGTETFHRRDLMLATEKEVRRLGLWASADDQLSGSVGLKSIGLANIDYRFSDLKRWGTIISSRRDSLHQPGNTEAR